MTKSPMQHNLSEHKKALQCRSQRIHQRDWIINHKRRSYSTNLKPTRSSSIHHQNSKSEFKFGHQLKSMRKDAPLSNQVEDIPKFVNDLNLEWNSFQTVLNTIFRFRKLLSRDPQHPPVTQVIDSGAVPYFVQLLNPTHIEQYCQIKKTNDESTDPSKANVISLHKLHALQYEVSWCISNIVGGGTSDHVKYIVETGCVPLLVNLLESKHSKVRSQSIWVVGNIAGDSEAMRSYLIELGAMKHLVNLVETDPEIKNKRDAVWSIANFFRGKKTPEKCGLITDTIPLLCQLILNHEMDEELLLNTCWALFYATDGPSHTFQHITAQKDVVMALVELLNSSNLEILTSVTGTLGNLLTGSDELTRMIVSCGVLPCLTKLFEHPNRGLRKLAMWSLSNITAGTSTEIQQVIDAEIFPKLIFMLSPAHNEAPKIKQEIYYVITNAFSGAINVQIQYLIDQGVIQVLCGALDMKSKILKVLLDGLIHLLLFGDREKVMKIIQDCGGVERIKALQQHKKEEIRQQARSILETFGRTFHTLDGICQRLEIF